MKRPKNLIQRFEYTKLLIGQEGFREDHWKALTTYNEGHGNRFFTTLHNGVLFNQYVGVIQVDNLTIEILPKVDRSNLDEAGWQTVLLDMLQECRWMQVHAHQEASLRLKHNNILEAYLEIYLNACERLLHEGLVKKYRHLEGNLYALKGKLKFAGHINRNVVHQERFYTEHSIYDRNNIFNRILLKALRVVPKFTNSPLLKDKLGRLLLDFPDLPDMPVSAKTFQNLVYDRKTKRYESALKIAAMLLLNFRPDVRGGRNQLLAILFDMNELWEEYFYRRARASLHQLLPDWSIERHCRETFWEMTSRNIRKIIRPDVVIRTPDNEAVVIDTKWKMPGNDVPSDADLKQVFVYNEYWGADWGILAYPKPETGQKPDWEEGIFLGRTSNCVVSKLSVLDENGRLKKDFTTPFIQVIKDKIEDYSLVKH